MSRDQERVIQLVRGGMTVHAALRKMGLRQDLSAQWCHVNKTYAEALRKAMQGDDEKEEQISIEVEP